jgi:hypothetical protein
VIVSAAFLFYFLLPFVSHSVISPIHLPSFPYASYHQRFQKFPTFSQQMPQMKPTLQLIPVLVIVAGSVAVWNPVDSIDQRNLDANENLRGLVHLLLMIFYNMHCIVLKCRK